MKSTIALVAISTGIVISTSGPWDSYIQSPATRDVISEQFFRTSGNMSGVITVQFGASTTSGSQLGAAFTENKQYIGIASNRATGPVLDGTLYAPAEPKSSFTFGRELGTRRRVWYAGAYTVQLCGISASEVHGAKRDRTPWPGDYGVATLSKAVSLNGDDLVSVRNALQSIIAIQASNGKFPYAGTLLVWGRVQRAFEFTVAKVDTSDSLLNVTDLSDWGRVGQGGKNTAASSLLYDALVSYVQLADALGYGELNYQGKTFSKIAEDLKSAVNSQLWDDSVGLFRDNTTALGAEFYPQDGNVLAVHFNVTDSLERAATISHSLTARWNEFGAVSPETLGSISPFMTSLEIDAHLRAHPSYATLATAIMRRQWSYMLNNFGKSTTMEAFYYTGELKCPFYEAVETNLGSYISHAHSWSTGMTASLTLHIGGLNPVEDAGRTWEFVPHAAGASVGHFADSFFTATITTPQDTTGSISVPTLGKSLETIEISVNGNAIWSNSTALWDGFGFAEGSNDYVTVSDVPSRGSFTIVAKEVSANTATSC
ncbi:glycoside hydrolase, putative [Phytophthora infestans T30-4]|uniref:Glycoside hydrolase, putative n=1 Tax=Phytophthora infestans (strain T30-4) TaxID=403677 RepID=D0NZS0_PHYIT|nr:glycoside hydrolase, putative [Phytophthora infestans T30-4]EEY69635.1 glycoside hydrolase, putative [Phytophthora infestans T30-4]|eukprot:XP_002997134.1 glycoside hydrolase, putative [Phytophthora infestans T30-4]